MKFIIFSIFALLLPLVATQHQYYPPQFQNISTTNNNPIYKNANIRVRIHEQVFQRSYQILQSLFVWQVQNAVIPTQVQCFPEGCVNIYDFIITGVTLPAKLSLVPRAPNYMHLQMDLFDLDITAKVSGNLQLLLGLPLTGNMIVTARNLQMPVTLELQKTNRRIPVAHISSCELLTGSVSAQLTDAGILTDMINLRYANELNMKARTLVESTLCDNMNRMIASQINTKLRHFPLLLNIFEVLKYLDNVKQRYSRNTFEQPSDIRWQRSLPGQTYSTATDESSVFHRNLTQIFDFNKLKNINLYLDIIDTSSSISDYIIGLDGKADLIDSSHAIPNTFISSNAPLNFPQNIRPKMLDVILSDSVLNDLLHQLWRGGAFVVKIDKRFPEFGHILKTSCSLDEVCISDSIPEVGENFPDQYLTITTSLIKSPIAVIKPHHIVLTLEGVSLFLVENNGKEVGQIPFIATILLELKMVENNSKVKLSLSVPKLEIKESVSFLGLKAEYLTSLKNGAVNVIQKFVNEKLSKGVDFQPFTSHLAQEFGVYYPVITLLDDGQILFQSDLDIQKLYYSPHFFN